MSSLFSVEHLNTTGYTFLVAGTLNTLFVNTARHLASLGSLVVLSEKSFDFSPQLSTVKEPIFIKPESAYLIDKVSERIDYIIFFLESQQDTKTLRHVISKAEKDSTRCIVVLQLDQLEWLQETLSSYVHNRHCTFLVTGDIFGSTTLSSVNPVSAIVNQFLEKKRVYLTGNDLASLFPFSEKDFLESIQYLLFSHRLKSHIYLAFYRHPQTYISLVHLLKRLEPELEVLFAQDTVLPERKDAAQVLKDLTVSTSVKPHFLSRVTKGFEKSVKELLDTPRGLPGATLETKVKSRKVNHKKKSSPPSTFSFIEAIATAILVYLLLSISAFGVSILFSQKALKDLSKAKVREATQSVKIASVARDISRPVVDPVIGLSPFAPQLSLFDKGLGALTQASQLVPALIQFSEGSTATVTLDTIISASTSLYFTTSHHLQSLPVKIRKSDLSQFASLLSVGQVAHEVLGYGGEKKYLVLFQNIGELRPTGGFIGSVGELSVKNGQIMEFQIQDVYDLDGQLTEHVEPHFIIRRYLQPHLYLRDSNFDLDFERSASSAARLYTLSTEKTVDGVIAVDYEVLRKIIEVTGPIHLPRQNTTVTSETAFAFIQDTIHKDFFPGSTQKRDILNEVFTQLLLKFEEDKSLTPKIARLLPQLLIEKHILFASGQDSVQRAFTSNNYSGTMNDLRVEDATQKDILSINEANIGTNKVNMNVERSVKYQIDMRRENIASEAEITYKNTDKKNTYRAYVRLLAPAGSSLESITINGQRQNTVPAVTDFRVYEARGFRPPAGLEVDIVNDYNATIFGFIIEVPKDASQVVRVAYKNSLNRPSVSQATYSLLYKKQPGTLPYKLSTTIIYPENYTVFESSVQSFAQGRVVATEDIDKDTEYKVKLIKRR